jgi:hypothetical protein
VLRSAHDGTSVDTLRSDKGSPFKKGQEVAFATLPE